MNCIYFVIPCYNEQEVLPITAEQLRIKYDQLLQSGLIAESSRILLVDDGSKDRTWQIISQLHQKDSRFQGVKLSRNRGHQNALLAGLMTARSFCDAAISLDADLQDDINAMDAMLQNFRTAATLYTAFAAIGRQTPFSSAARRRDTINSCPAWAANWSTTMLTTGS